MLKYTNRLKKLLKLLGIIIGVQLIGNLGTIATIPAIAGWYATLNKPFFTPPNWLFAPVWTTLFLLMAVSLFLIYENGADVKAKKSAYIFFALQLLFNVLWSFIFFGLKLPLVALAEIVILLILIIKTAKSFLPISKAAAYLLVPYLLWVCLATALNFAIVILN